MAIFQSVIPFDHLIDFTAVGIENLVGFSFFFWWPTHGTTKMIQHVSLDHKIEASRFLNLMRQAFSLYTCVYVCVCVRLKSPINYNYFLFK